MFLRTLVIFFIFQMVYLFIPWRREYWKQTCDFRITIILFFCSSSLSQKIGLQEDDQTKALRPARLMRGRLQRPKPNVGKAAERKEILASQEKIEANAKKNESESCIARDVSTLILANLFVKQVLKPSFTPFFKQQYCTIVYIIY